MADYPKHVREWMKTRTRAGKMEYVEYGEQIPGLEPIEIKRDNRDRPIYVYANDHLHCNCSGCDHTYQFECDPDNDTEHVGCRCCHQMCT